MPAPGLNGHGYGVTGNMPEQLKAAMLARIEGALGMMTMALVEAGFSEYEAAEINLSTRHSITGMIKDRRRGK